MPPTNAIKQLHKDLSYLNESQAAEQQGELASLINDSASTINIAQEITANTSRLTDLTTKNCRGWAALDDGYSTAFS